MLIDQSYYIFMLSQNEYKWLIFYTSPRAEKIAFKNLISLGYNVFLPLERQLKYWKNRQRKLVELPLFPNYIFVYAKLSDIYSILKISKICTYVKVGNTPALLSDSDIEAIKIMESLNMTSSSIEDFDEGDYVEIINGPLSGYRGFYIGTKNKFGIKIHSINMGAMIEISPFDIKKISI